MKNTIEIGHLTLHKKNVRPNRAVVWDSNNLVLNTNIDMAKLFSELVFLEHETSSLKTNLQKAASEISLAISRNQYNSEFVSFFALQMSESVLRITDINKIAILEVKKLNTFDQTITICEEEAGLEFSKLHDYILSLKRLQLAANVLEEHTVESQLSLDLLEKDLQKNQNMLDRLAAEIRDIEFMLDILKTRLLTISIRITPALNVLLELRVLASNLRLKFINFIARLKYVELHISICLLMTNTLDERRAYLTGIVLHQKNMVNKLEALFENMTNRHYELMCKIAILYQKVLELTNIANEINDYITKMKLLIEGGLLKAGENIAIEYTAEGFAKIHSTLAPYPKREPRTRKVIKAKPMVFRIPPNPCPPLLPPCPDISATQKPTSSPTTAPTSSPTTAPTSSPTTTTTTTTKAPKIVVSECCGSTECFSDVATALDAAFSSFSGTGIVEGFIALVRHSTRETNSTGVEQNSISICLLPYGSETEKNALESAFSSKASTIICGRDRYFNPGVADVSEETAIYDLPKSKQSVLTEMNEAMKLHIPALNRPDTEFLSNCNNSQFWVSTNSSLTGDWTSREKVYSGLLSALNKLSRLDYKRFTHS